MPIENKRSYYQHLSAMYHYVGYHSGSFHTQEYQMIKSRFVILKAMILSYSYVILLCNTWSRHFTSQGLLDRSQSNSTPSQSLGVGFQLVAEDRNQDSQEHVGAYLMGAEHFTIRSGHRCKSWIVDQNHMAWKLLPHPTWRIIPLAHNGLVSGVIIHFHLGSHTNPGLNDQDSDPPTPTPGRPQKKWCSSPRQAVLRCPDPAAKRSGSACLQHPAVRCGFKEMKSG